MTSHASTIRCRAGRPVRWAGPLVLALASLAATALPALAQRPTITLDELRRLGEVDSAYASPGLRDFVGRAADANETLPDRLAGYETEMETEISLVQTDDDGRETVLQVEQVASDVLWRRSQDPVQEVVGYRATSLGPIPSLLTMFEVPWVVPTLYGERIDLVRWNTPTTNAEGRVLRRRAVHPLAPERARIYRFTGGDTVTTLRLPERTLRLVRVHVEPVRFPDRPTLLFDGWMDLDADRAQIVRMRGRMIDADPSPSLDERLVGAAFSSAVYVELESQEIDQAYWLPRYQRIEIQAISRLTDDRIGLRLVSRVAPPFVGTDGPLAARYREIPPGGLLVLDDAVREADYEDWRAELGELTASTNALDFRSLEPDAGRDAGDPSLRPGVPELSHLFRLNEAEGVYTGMGLSYRPGHAWKEGRVQAWGGWAWREGTARGGLRLSHAPADGEWEWQLGAERTLVGTNDVWIRGFAEPGVPPLVAADGEVVFDHRIASLVARQPRDAGWSMRLEAARAQDRGIVGSGFETAVRNGSYWLGRATVERNPGAVGLGVLPGTALRFHLEGGTGDLEWVRAEAGVGTRTLKGPVSLEGSVAGGATVSGDPPPQRLFELGRSSGLAGYEERAFTGDRMALVHAAVSYSLPILRRPLGGSGFWLPAPAPAPTVFFRSGWVDASDDALPVVESVAGEPSDGWRSSFGVGLRLFGGGLSLGVARPLESGGEWRFVWSLARDF